MNSVEQDKKHKPQPKVGLRHSIGISGFICLFFSLGYLVLEILYFITFHLYSGSGGLNSTIGSIWYRLIFWPFFFFHISLFWIIIYSVLLIFKKPRLPRLTVLSICCLLCVLTFSSRRLHYSKYEGLDPARYFLYNEVYLNALHGIQQTLPPYAKLYEGMLPPPENWCDVLADFGLNLPNPSPEQLSMSRLTDWSRYAINSNLTGMRLADIPNDVVLIFETEGGENPYGGADSITSQHHYGKGAVVLFADLHIEFIKAKDFNDLRWKP
jgi:hypothetical protein